MSVNNMNEEQISPEEAFKRLTDFGFEKIGQWKIAEEGEKNAKNGYAFKLESTSGIAQKRGIYAFVAFRGGKPDGLQPVKYVGINETTNTPLIDRLKKYSTNPKNSQVGNITTCITSGCSLNVYAYIPDSNNTDNRCYKDVEIDYVKGLENGLIKYLNAEWNSKR